MTKQKEMIRKSIEEHVELCLKASGGLPSETFSRSISYSLVELLDCLGVVLKVKRALTITPFQAIDRGREEVKYVETR